MPKIDGMRCSSVFVLPTNYHLFLFSAVLRMLKLAGVESLVVGPHDVWNLLSNVIP